jgi:hypothetical protein
MNIFKSLLTSIGVLPRKNLKDTLSPGQLEQLSVELRIKRSKSLFELLQRYKRIASHKIVVLAELGSFIYNNVRLRDLYKKLNAEEYDSLIFDDPAKEFEPTADYVEVFYCEVVDGKKYVFVCINRYSYEIEPGIEELFEITKPNTLDLSRYNGAILYQGDST